MIQKLILLSFLPLLLFSCVEPKQKADTSSVKFSKAELLEDIDYLENHLRAGHPGLFWHSSEKDFESAISSVKASLKAEMTELEFLQELAKLNSAIQCAHSDIRPSEAYDQFWKDSVKLLPFNLMKHGAEYLIFQNYSDKIELKYGTRVMSINGESIDSILQKLLAYIPADGDNQSRKFFALRSGFYRYYSYYINSKSKNFTIGYLTPEGIIEQISVPGISKKTLNQRREALDTLNKAPISFNLLDQGDGAVLRISSFRSDLMTKSQINFESFIDSCFKVLQAQNIKHLIIDVQDNGGGTSEYAAILFSYLSDTAFEYCKSLVLSTDQKLEGIEYDIPETFQGFPEGIIKEDGHFKWTKHSILGWRQPSLSAFKGKLYFLINGGCSSTTTELLTLARLHNKGIFIGEEAGGEFTGNSSGVIGWLRLPHTQIAVRMAMVKYVISEKTHELGLHPTYKYQTSWEDILNRANYNLEFALNLIQKDSN